MDVISKRTLIFVAIQVCFITVHGLRSGEPTSNANVKSFLKPSRSVRSDDETVLPGRCLAPTEDIKVHNFTESANEDEIHISCTCHDEGVPPQWQLTNEEGLCLNATEDQIVNNSIIVDYHLHKNITLYCIQKDCVNKFIVIVHDADSDISKETVSLSLQGFVIFLVVSVVVFGALFFTKNYRSHIYLGFRDTLGPTALGDGREFDAYVSIASSESDRKFVERNVIAPLQRNHHYKFFLDDESLLKQLEYTERVKSRMHKCRRLILVLTPTYMTNDWCMYCFSEGLRKILELNMELLIVISDLSIQRELKVYGGLLVNVPQIYIPVSQSVKDNDVALRQIRLFLPSASGRKISTNDMKEPILNDAEDIDSRSVSESDNYGGMETKYTFSRNGDVPLDTHHIDPTFDDEYEYDMEGDDPDTVQIHSYGARKDFYTLTMDTGN